MIEVNKLRNGAVFKYEGEPFVVVNYDHKKMGRGNASIKLKIKNLKTGVLKDLGLYSGARLEEADVERKRAQFLYSDKNTNEHLFMDPENYEQFSLSDEIVGEYVPYLKEGAEVYIVLFEDEPITVDITPHVVLKVTETEPGLKGDSVSNVFKPATLESGIVLQVPLFIKEGDMVEIDTRTGEYVGRIS